MAKINERCILTVEGVENELETIRDLYSKYSYSEQK